MHNVEIKLVAEFSDRPILADAELIYCKKLENSFLYGLRFPEPGLTQVFQYIFQNKYPNLKNLYEFPVDEIKSLFDKSGYFALKPREEMDRNFENMVRSHYRLRSQPQLSTNIAYIQNNNIISGASLLRIYNHTVLGQHLAGLREARRNVRSKTDIYLAFNDFGLNYNDFSYFISYFNSANEWHGRMYRRIGEMIHDENYFMVDTIGFFQCSIDRLPPRPSQSRYTVRAMENPAEFIAYSCNLKSLERDCYAYDEANINLEKVKALYRQKGMYLERRIYTVYQECKIVAYIVAESYTAGLNLYNILDMCRFYFTTTGFQLNQMMEAVLPEIASFFWQYQKKNFNVLLKGTQEEFGQIKVNGLEYAHLLGRVMISKRGFYLYRNALQVLFDKSRSLRYS